MRDAWLGLVGVWLAASVVSAAPRTGYLGTASCTTSTCHGGVIGRGPEWNHSLSTWVASDPHAGAGLLLRDEDSRAIVVRLDAEAAESPEAFDTVLRKRCISCHATPAPEQCSQTGLLSNAVLAEGVSCEACHGAAGSWLGPHVRVDWAGPPRFEPDTGMTDTESILGRAEICVRCHIGSRRADGLTRDVNHDLVAAGHPALRFDGWIYNQNLPKHWDPAGEVEIDFNQSAVRVRSVGRAINLAAAAALSSERASDHLQDRNVPWPELADYDCFACHQALSMHEYALPPTGNNKSPLHISHGLPIWNSWHTVNQLELRDHPDLLKKLSPHRSDPKQIALGGKTLATKYRKLARQRMSANVAPHEAMEMAVGQLRGRPPVDWHQAAIQYLEIDAALRDLANKETTLSLAKNSLEDLSRIERLLRFDPARVEGEVARYHSPAEFDPHAFRSALLRLLNMEATSPPADGVNN